MKNFMRCSLVGLLVAGASIAYGAVPPMSVLVADSSGKAAFRGALDSKGTFATGTLTSGAYIVQFNARGVPRDKFALVVSAGNKKVVASAVEGGKFAGGGVAMRIDVSPGLQITGQVSFDAGGNAPIGTNGKPMVWIPRQLGSNLPAHWSDSDSAEAKQAMTASSYSFKNLQDAQAQGVGLR